MSDIQNDDKNCFRNNSKNQVQSITGRNKVLIADNRCRF